MRHGTAAIGTAFMLAAGLGVFDEWHQLHVPGRYASFTDIRLNCSGAYWCRGGFTARSAARHAWKQTATPPIEPSIATATPGLAGLPSVRPDQQTLKLAETRQHHQPGANLKQGHGRITCGEVQTQQPCDAGDDTQQYPSQSRNIPNKHYHFFHLAPQ
jgi:hypothetical protein